MSCICIMSTRCAGGCVAVCSQLGRLVRDMTTWFTPPGRTARSTTGAGFKIEGQGQVQQNSSEERLQHSIAWFRGTGATCCQERVSVTGCSARQGQSSTGHKVQGTHLYDGVSEPDHFDVEYSEDGPQQPTGNPHQHSRPHRSNMIGQLSLNLHSNDWVS